MVAKGKPTANHVLLGRSSKKDGPPRSLRENRWKTSGRSHPLHQSFLRRCRHSSREAKHSSTSPCSARVSCHGPPERRLKEGHPLLTRESLGSSRASTQPFIPLHQGSGCIIHLNIATCKWWFPFISVWQKQHVSTGCKQHELLLRSPVHLTRLLLLVSNSLPSFAPRKGRFWLHAPADASPISGLHVFRRLSSLEADLLELRCPGCVLLKQA